MALQALKDVSNQQGIQDILTEVQGLAGSYVAGAAAGTKMNIAKLRTVDTVFAALIGTDAGGAWTDDSANITIQPTKATGTLTFTTILNNDTFTVNGALYTFKDTPTAIRDVKRTAGDNNANALAANSAINTWENRRLNTQKPNAPAVVATVLTNVVTLTATTDGAGNGISLVNSANATVAGNGTASATATCVSVVNTNTLTVSGVVFTAVTAIAAAAPAPAYGDKANPTQAKVGGATANDAGMAAEFARVINKYENSRGTLDVTASAVGNVLTLVPRTGNKGNIVTIAGGQGTVVASAATIAGGTATGGIKSTTNLTGKSVFVLWFNKDGV